MVNKITSLSFIFNITFLLSYTFSWMVMAEKNYSIYIDADFSSSQASSLAIKQGITTALAEVNNEIQGFKFNIVIKDHRANSLRSKKNLENYLENDKALFIFSGLHSPPLLSNKSFINENEILMFSPWAAAGPITRADKSSNWIFRLSIDDTNAGAFIVKRALAEGFTKPYLLLEDTGWGRSNQKTMIRALKNNQREVSGITWFNWGLGKHHAKLLLRNIADTNSDVIFFVGNSPEGKTFIKAMIDLPDALKLPVRSHWGITGGTFAQEINAEQRSLVDLQFIQTRFSFLNPSLSKIELSVLELAKKHNSDINSKNDIKAQSGFVHSYDLTKIIIAAINQSGLTGNKAQDKASIRKSLTHLKLPVAGLIKTYKSPFSQYNTDTPNAHEALRIEDYTMGYYSKNNNVLLLNSTQQE